MKMKDNIYWLMLFIHVTIYTFFTLSGFAADPPIEDKSQLHKYTGIVNKLKNKISLEAYEKVCLARAHFYLGNLQHTKAILDTENRTKSIQDGLPDGLKNSDLLSKRDLESLKCHRLFRPKFSKVKRRFFVEIPEVSDTLTPNVGVSGDTPVL